jgi:hypothetical protein
VTIRPNAIEDDGNVGEEFGHYIESSYRERLIFDILACSASWKGGYDLPQTVHRINSISASGSRASFKLIAIADCPMMMVPM